jgi:hypothetical protein
MREVSIKIKKYYIQLVFFFLVVLFVTRQIPLMKYSFIMNISLFIFFILNSKYIIQNIRKNKFIGLSTSFIVMMLFFMVFYSFCLGNNLFLITRFFIILGLILFAYFVKPHTEYISIFIFFITLQALFVIGLEIFLIIFFDDQSYRPLRMYFLNNNFGDIYISTGKLFRIQLMGNALLPFAFFISMIYYEKKKKKFFTSIFLIAILCAGNFAFILGVLLFSVLYYIYTTKWTMQKLAQNTIFGIVLFLIVSFPAFNYLIEVVKYKSMESNPVRIDQANVLINDLSENFGTALFGKGLGNTIDVTTQWRNYSNSIYYELQSLYILNQVGILFFVLYVTINIIIAKYIMKHTSVILAYFCYIFYALFNPYFLDTNHIVAIIVLLSLKKILDEKNILNNSYI